MTEHSKKVRKTTISGGSHHAVKRGRIHRFAKWTEEFYGIPFRGMYEKLRRGKIKKWESVGITRCLQEYGFHGSPGELWNVCIRNKFCAYMETRQMSRMTTWKRFSANDFSELEMNGIRETYIYWRTNIDSKQ